MKKFVIAIVPTIVPTLVFAVTDFADIGKVIKNFNSNVIATLGLLFLAVALVAFFFGVVRFILAQQGGDAKKAESGRKFMLWGLIGLFVAFSVYGIIKFAQTSLGITDNQNINKPCVNFISGCNTNINGVDNPPFIPTNSGALGGSNSQTGVGVPQNSISVCDGYIGGDGKCYSDTCPSGCVVVGSGEGNTNVTGCNSMNVGSRCEGGAGICKNTPLVGYVCETTPQTGICFGKNEWASCEGDGYCLSLGESRLACRHGITIVSSGGYCQPSGRSRICESGTACLFLRTESQNDYYTCQ